MPEKLSPSRHLRIGQSKAGLGLFARVAIKDIKPGDEITYHYGRDYFDSFIKAVP
jgi:SET domain-containing protein